MCCGQSSCITSCIKFLKVCLEKDIFEIAIIARANYRADKINFRNNDYRKAAYCQFCLWRYGKLGKGNRRVLPSSLDIQNQKRLTLASDHHNILQSCSQAT